jgi:uncharacterized protein YkwD
MSKLFRGSKWQLIAREEHFVLMEMAQARAEDMAQLGYFSHVDQRGIWPNENLRKFGYSLPDNYPDDSNQVESIAKGFLTAKGALTALVESPAHHDHMVGKGMWNEHTAFGVGYATAGGDTYYVIVTAPPDLGLHTVYLPAIERLLVNP